MQAVITRESCHAMKVTPKGDKSEPSLEGMGEGHGTRKDLGKAARKNSLVGIGMQVQ